MTTFPSNQTIAVARRLHESLATDNLPPKIAKLYSQNTRLQQNQRGLSNWRSEDVALRLNEAARLIDAALVEREAEFSDWHQGMRRAAELLEWLSHPMLNVNNLPLRLLAAAAYQIAGYPARSGSLLATESPDSNESAILRSFLRTDFQATFHELGAYWIKSDEQKEQGAEETGEVFDDVIVAEVASALGILCAEMRWSDESRLDKALEKLQSVAKLLLFGRDPYSWLLARLCADVATTFVQSSLRAAVRGLRESLTPIGSMAIERYIRQNYLTRRSLAWSSQQSGIAQLLTGDNFALCTPTGSGKTTIAELAIIKGLFNRTDETGNAPSRPLALYLVPSRALAAEVEARLSRVVRRLGDEVNIVVTGLYGGTDWGPTDAWLTSDEPTVLICTYEKAEALIRFLGPLFIHRVSLLIIDEAHTINFQGEPEKLEKAEDRSLRLETLCARLLSFLDARHSQAIALSAVASGSDDTLACWIKGQNDASAIRTYYRSTRQLVGRLECTNNRFRIQYDLLDGASLRFEDEGEESTLFIPDPFPPVPETNGFIGNEKRLRPYLFWAAMHLAKPDESKRARAVLISITQGVGGYAQDFLDLIEKQWGASVPSFFTPPTSGEHLKIWQECLASCADYFDTRSREYRLLEKGIVVHHGKMPGLLARKLIELIQSGVVHIILATSTLTEGVNLPFDTILIPNLRRYNGNLTVQEFANLVGRAGRPGLAVEGRSLVLLPMGDYHSREVLRQYTGLIQGMQQQRIASAVAVQSPLAELIVHLETLWQRIHRNGTRADFEAWLEHATTIEDENVASVSNPSDEIATLDTLDSFLLSIIVEAEELAGSISMSADDLEERLKRVWQRSYARYASEEQARLQSVFVRRGKALITTIIPESRARKQLYQISLSPRAGRVLLRLYPVIRRHLASGTGYARMSAERQLDYIKGLVDHIAGMPLFTFPLLKKTIPVNTALHWWLSPADSPQTPTPSNISDWHGYIATHFVYRFNWALGSILSLCINEVHGGELRETSIEEWPQTGLPWVVFWLKELITWGTLEPVVAYLLARGMAVTRPEALEKSLNYYQSRDRNEDAEDLLHPGKIREWAEMTYGREAKTTRPRPFPEIRVSLTEDFSGVSNHSWRVLPVATENRLHWYDPAGFLMGISQKPSDWHNSNTDTFDFYLDSIEKTISSSFYI